MDFDLGDAGLDLAGDLIGGVCDIKGGCGCILLVILALGLGLWYFSSLHEEGQKANPTQHESPESN